MRNKRIIPTKPRSGLNSFGLLFIVIIAFIDGILFAQSLENKEGGVQALVPEKIEALLNRTDRAEEPELEEIGSIFEETLEGNEGPLSEGPLKDDLEATEQVDESTEPKIVVPEPYVIPFVSQAPLWDWKDPWSDFAEEAVIVMARHWLNETEPLSARSAGNELLAIQAPEKQLTLDAIASLIVANTEIKAITAFQELYQLLDQGHILIAPVNGQVLANPYYGNPAPKHHVILIYNYEPSTGEFIAHDPGTNRGEATTYNAQKILDSIQDLDGSKRVLVVKR